MGISCIGYNPERHAIVEYSHPLGEAAIHWVSKPPGRLSAATNILRIFEYEAWVMILVSIISISAAFIVISKIGRSYGVETPLDNFLVFILPLATLTAECMPRSFKSKSKERNKSFFSPGFAGNGLLLLWTVAAAFISMAFLSMIRQTSSLQFSDVVDASSLWHIDTAQVLF